MCEWGTMTSVFVKIPADLSSTGKTKWKWEQIDSCIAELVDALQTAGIDMRGSCCGHGKDFGDIHLQDGRVLVITDISYMTQEWQWGFRAVRRAIYLTTRYYSQFIREPRLVGDWLRKSFLSGTELILGV